MLLIPSYLLFCPTYPSLSSLKPLSQSPFNSPFPSISPDFYYLPSFRIIPPPHQSFGILFKLWFNFSILSSVCFWKTNLSSFHLFEGLEKGIFSECATGETRRVPGARRMQLIAETTCRKLAWWGNSIAKGFTRLRVPQTLAFGVYHVKYNNP